MELVIKIMRQLSARARLAVFLTIAALFLSRDVAGIVHRGFLPRQSLFTNTWSIVAADPDTGDVGVAMASCIPDSHDDAVGALVPRGGVAAIQALWDLDNRNEIFDMLQAGDSASTIIERMSLAEDDPQVDIRQYGVVTIHDGELDIAAFSGEAVPEWYGDQQDTEYAVTVQGNTLVGEEVVADALAAFTADEPGYNSLADRLMRALEAGSAAGGDSRCNSLQVTQTAANAFILVARGSDEPYATENIGMTDAGTPAAPWLALSVAETRFGPNPVVELRRQYDEWRLENLESLEETGAVNPISPLLFVLLPLALLVVTGLIWVSRRKAGTDS